ncbi:hypothetical protein LTR36_002184 [Oleoguttula mirabilis]|uniref:Uncharacterized protein n=1 Tax=Oleoguttula mirabilis TaxID=1507867 RepID=A0AAV9JL46_9PEZI|nr:hypothetical protein LTR36_002184 [Oleoguttula mirabilis]
MSAEPVASQPEHHLLTIPQEIQDIIFDFAYPQPSEVAKFVGREAFDELEKAKLRINKGDYTIRPFVHNRINEMMVSKKFFVAAALAYVTNQIWKDVLLDEHICAALHEAGGIVCAWASTVSTSGVLTHPPMHHPRLKNLTVTLSEWMWDDVDDKFAWEVRYTTDELKRGKYYEDLSELRGLRTFEIVAGENESAKTKRQQKKWRRNCRAFEALLKPIVTQPKTAAPEFPDGDSSATPVPLYPGCAVCFETSELRRIGADCDIDYGLTMLYKAKGDEAFDSELTAISQKSAAEYAKRKLIPGNYLHNREVPDDLKELREMLYWNGEDMMDWIRDAKRRTGLPTLKPGLSEREKQAETVHDGALDLDTAVMLGASALLVCTWCAWAMMAVSF